MVYQNEQRKRFQIDGAMWPVGQAVKTGASHAPNVGSIPARVTIYNCISVGVDDDEGPPVPIPNTEVKLIDGENTCLATDREDSKMPTLCYGVAYAAPFFYLTERGRSGKI